VDPVLLTRGEINDNIFDKKLTKQEKKEIKDLEIKIEGKKKSELYLERLSKTSLAAASTLGVALLATGGPLNPVTGVPLAATTVATTGLGAISGLAGHIITSLKLNDERELTNKTKGRHVFAFLPNIQEPGEEDGKSLEVSMVIAKPKFATFSKCDKSFKKEYAMYNNCLTVLSDLDVLFNLLEQKLVTIRLHELYFSDLCDYRRTPQELTDSIKRRNDESLVLRSDREKIRVFNERHLYFSILNENAKKLIIDYGDEKLNDLQRYIEKEITTNRRDWAPKSDDDYIQKLKTRILPCFNGEDGCDPEGNVSRTRVRRPPLRLINEVITLRKERATSSNLRKKRATSSNLRKKGITSSNLRKKGITSSTLRPVLPLISETQSAGGKKTRKNKHRKNRTRKN